MPIRELMYAALLYDKYIKEKRYNIFGSSTIEIPVPRLVVFYNGIDDKEDETILELKDAFPEGADPELSDIQVRVRMINIKYGHNKKILDACKPLTEYSWFIEQIRENKASNMDIEQAVDKALADMPDDFEIKKFLLSNQAEVKNMCLLEYSEEEILQLFKEEYLQEGWQKGWKKGRQAGQQETLASIVNLLKTNGLYTEAIASTIGFSVDALNQVIS